MVDGLTVAHDLARPSLLPPRRPAAGRESRRSRTFQRPPVGARPPPGQEWERSVV
jgi:hypothetical protein